MMFLGVDPGERRYGVAIADPETRFARPLLVIDAAVADPVDRIASLVQEMGVTEVVVGRPVGLSGRAGPAVEATSSFVARLREAVGASVVEHDERLTTRAAQQGLRGGGASRRTRRRIVDAVAAQVMLQGYLDARDRS